MKFTKENVLVNAALFLFLASLALPAVVYIGGRIQFGYELLGWGWFGILAGVPGWFANVCGLAAWSLVTFSHRPYPAFMTSLAAVALAASVPFTFHEFYFDEASSTAVNYLSVGFYVWGASFVLLALHCFLAKRTRVQR